MNRTTMEFSNGNVKERLKNVYNKMKTLENWRKTVLFVCLAALAIDPLFFFIPVIDSQRFCVTFDKNLGVAVCVLRTFIDAFYVIHIILHFITMLSEPRSQGSLRGEIFVQSTAIRRSLLLFYFIVDILSVLPIPQMVLLTVITRKQPYISSQMLLWVVISQNIPRIIRFYPLLKEVTRASGTVSETKWIGAALNFSLYMLQSHAFGAFWYLGAIEKKHSCWREACAIMTPGCNLMNMYCPRGGVDNSRFLNTSCSLIDPDQITKSSVFNFGIYISALKSGVVESMDFSRKFSYCFWWGLRNLSALGQNLETSNSIGEIFFAIFICISGLLLFAVLIGNVQKYLQSTTIRVDEMEEKKRDTDKWMSRRKFPKALKKAITKFNKQKWCETRGTEEAAHFGSLPKHLRIKAKRYLYLDYLKRVPEFQVLNDQLLDELCARLKEVLYTRKSYIVHESDPLEKMFFIVRGDVMSSTTWGEGTRFLLQCGGFCGDLLTWTLDPHATHLPISSRTFEAITDVEVVVLSVDDLKFVINMYVRLHSEEAKHMFRFFSVQWQTWAACTIQGAWERHCRRKLSKALREGKGNKLNLGAAIYASRFANSLKNVRANASAKNSRLLPQKPADPEFTVDET